MRSPIASEIKSLLSYFLASLKTTQEYNFFLPETKKQLEYLFIECKDIPG